MKVQYPGVARSIDSDVDNVVTLLRLSGMLPKGLDVGPLLAEAKEQLRAEADYVQEAEHMRRFAGLLDGDEQFRVPAAHDDLSTSHVLTMSYEESEPLEALTGASQDRRDLIGASLSRLCLRELFDWGWMQTDPNMANFRWDGERGQVVLLDFGATREVPAALSELYRCAIRAACNRDRVGAEAVLEAFGALDARTSGAVRAEVLDLFDLAAKALLHNGPFDFGESDLLATLHRRGMTVALDRSTWRVPPAEMIFVQRKLGGFFLLAAQLKARVDLRELVELHL